MTVLIKKATSFARTIQTYKNWGDWLLSWFGLRSRKKSFITAKTREGAILQTFNNREGWTVIDEIWRNKIYTRHFEIKPGFKVLDIGANCGLFSVYAATRHRSVSVISYEPAQATFEMVEKNIRVNHLESQIKSFHFGLAKEEGSFVLYTPEGLPGSASLDKKSACLSGRRVLEEIVKIESAEDIWKHFPKYDFAKIDCEGAEYDIFDVLGNSIKNFHYLVVEFHRGSESLISALEKRGFKIIEIFEILPPELGILYAENQSFKQ